MTCLTAAPGTGLPCAPTAPTRLILEAPIRITRVSPEVVLVDFGRVAFGNLLLAPPPASAKEIAVHFGEAFADGRINRHPPGSVRYSMSKVSLAGQTSLVVEPGADARNTGAGNASRPPAVLTPKEWGVLVPFRWIEIEGWPGELRQEDIGRQAAFSAAWDDSAAGFQSSDEILDRIWELCRYSIKATTFAGVYVDGDRERIAYEGDAYLNQLSHYATDNDTRMARDTFDWLIKHPTWPTEWAFHMIFMAHADWMRTGDSAWLAPRYKALKSKLLLDRARSDGLLVSNEAQIKRDDIVDWPVNERDGFAFRPINTVVNAFHLRSLALMAELANALGKESDAADYKARERKTRTAFQENLFDGERGIYRDGGGTEHASQHANLFPLAFGLVPDEHRAGVTEFVARRGMACSVYAAQYLMEGLFSNDAGARALELITAVTDRSWRHMVESGATITWEAWDQKYKPNQDWNHAWGAAPANLLPRFVLGAEPLSPGWSRALIRPNPGALEFASGKIPTPRGPVLVDWKQGSTFTLKLILPEGMTARVELPAIGHAEKILLDGHPVAASRQGRRWVLDGDVSRSATVELGVGNK